MSAWRKAKRCNHGECVEVRRLGPSAVAIRDSKDEGGGAMLRFTVEEFAAFLAGAQAGEFDDLAEIETGVKQ